MPLSFCDTNILIYAYADSSDSRKQAIAHDLMGNLLAVGEGCLSAQVLSEFFWVSTLKMRPPMSIDSAQIHVQRLSRMKIVSLDELLVSAAIDRTRKSQISYWDALIVEAALAAGAEILFSEDLQHGMLFDSLRVMNPFL